MEMNENAWDDSAWFQRWLEMAREQQEQENNNFNTPNSVTEPEKGPAALKAAAFMPPYGDWNFTLRELAMLDLPRLAA